MINRDCLTQVWILAPGYVINRSIRFHMKLEDQQKKKLEVSIFKTNYFGLNGVFDQFIKDAIAKISKRAIC